MRPVCREGKSAGVEWAGRCAALSAMWHPNLVEMLDFGTAGREASFEALGCESPPARWKERDAATARALLAVVGWLHARGCRAGRLSWSDVVRTGEGPALVPSEQTGMPLAPEEAEDGDTERCRAVRDDIEQLNHLLDACHVSPRDPPAARHEVGRTRRNPPGARAGCGRQARGDPGDRDPRTPARRGAGAARRAPAAGAARQPHAGCQAAGYVPVTTSLLERCTGTLPREELLETLALRHVLLLHRAGHGATEADLALWLLRLGLSSSRPHVALLLLDTAAEGGWARGWPPAMLLQARERRAPDASPPPGEYRARGRILESCARISRGRHAAAQRLLHETLGMLTRRGDRAGAGEAALALGRLLLQRGQPVEAGDRFESAREQFDAARQVTWAARPPSSRLLPVPMPAGSRNRKPRHARHASRRRKREMPRRGRSPPRRSRGACTGKAATRKDWASSATKESRRPAERTCGPPGWRSRSFRSPPSRRPTPGAPFPAGWSPARHEPALRLACRWPGATSPRRDARPWTRASAREAPAPHPPSPRPARSSPRFTRLSATRPCCARMSPRAWPPRARRGRRFARSGSASRCCAASTSADGRRRPAPCRRGWHASRPRVSRPSSGWPSSGPGSWPILSAVPPPQAERAWRRPPRGRRRRAMPAGEFVANVVEVLGLCQACEDDEAAIRSVLARLRRRLGMVMVACVARDGPVVWPLASEGRDPGARSRRATGPRVRPGAAAVVVALGTRGSRPVRFAGRVVAALACRWPADEKPDWARAGAVLAAAAAAVAPSVRCAVDRRTADAQANAAAREEILGVSQAVLTLRQEVARAAAAPFSVIVEGESGSGKELVARAVHRLGPRATGGSAPSTAPRSPDDLFEAELFGHARGRVHRRGGRAERAVRGGRRRHAGARRGRRADRPRPGEAAAGHPGRRNPPRRRELSRPVDVRLVVGHQPAAARRRGAGVPARPALPTGGDPDRRAAAARPRRRHPGARRALLAERPPPGSGAGRRWRRRRWPPWRGTTGRATCGNCRT